MGAALKRAISYQEKLLVLNTEVCLLFFFFFFPDPGLWSLQLSFHISLYGEYLKANIGYNCLTAVYAKDQTSGLLLIPGLLVPAHFGTNSGYLISAGPLPVGKRQAIFLGTCSPVLPYSQEPHWILLTYCLGPGTAGSGAWGDP